LLEQNQTQTLSNNLAVDSALAVPTLPGVLCPFHPPGKLINTTNHFLEAMSLTATLSYRSAHCKLARSNIMTPVLSTSQINNVCGGIINLYLSADISQ
jgi:hypothetical protein